MNPCAPIVDYYFSCASPWAYLGHARFVTMLESHGASARPFALDFNKVVFPATGGLPLGQRPPARRAYRLQELERWRERQAVRLNLQPAHFPVDDTAVAVRIVALREDGNAAGALALAGAAMAAVWSEERNIADPAEVDALCAATAQDPSLLTERVEQLAAASLRERDSLTAVDRGVFGAPTYAVGNHLLWGQDRLEFLPGLLQP